MVVSLVLLGAAVSSASCKKPERPAAKAAEPAPQGLAGLTEAQSKQVLVKVGDTVITVGDLAAELASQSPYVRTRFQSPERKKEFLDNMVRFELLAAEARRRGYDRSPDVVRRRKQLLIQLYLQQEVEDKIKLADISEADIKAYYQAHPAEFRKPEQVRASQILVKDLNRAQRYLQQVLEHAGDDEYFRKAVKDHSEDAPTRELDGDLHFFSRPSEKAEGDPDVPAAVAEAAFAIERVGGVSPQLVRTERGYHIVRLVSRREALNRSLDEVRAVIQNKLWRERREKAVADLASRLRREARIKEDLTLLAKVRLDPPKVDASAAKSPPAKSGG